MIIKLGDFGLISTNRRSQPNIHIVDNSRGVCANIQFWLTVMNHFFVDNSLYPFTIGMIIFCSNNLIKIIQIPVRYTALESLHHKIYSIESELWTFGVVLWELFTFAQTMPYEKELPNFNVAILKIFLNGGHRLTPPDTAPLTMYRISHSQ